MATESRPDRRKIALSAVCVLLAGYMLFQWNSAPPQLPVRHDAIMQTVDALFTAISTRDTRHLQECRLRLQRFEQSGELPAAAAQRLTSLIEQADRGAWEAAGRALYDFMLGQRGQTT